MATIGGVRWLAENLNITTFDSWCYDNDNSNCGKYGRLYTWEAAKSACELLGVGWHLPSRSEWQELVRAVDPNAQFSGSWDDNNVAGKKLKSKTGWYSDSGTDDFGFSALPGGLRNLRGYFSYAGDNGYWWTATEDSVVNAYNRAMYYNYDYVREDNDHNGYRFSVRCCRD
jgi:uncharacterized protein (TIGR02145 family)